MDTIYNSLSIAYSTLRKNKGRVIMTIFGITIGIAMVIIVFSAGEGVKGLIMGEISSFGNNWINIEIKVPSTSKNSHVNALAIAHGVSITTLNIRDAEEISKIKQIKYLYAGVTSQSIVTYKNEKKRPLIFGVTPDYHKIDKGKIEFGRFYTQSEEDSSAQVVVLGHSIAEDLFGNDNPIGKMIKIDKKSFRVIGVMEKRGVSGFFNFDETAFIPLKTTQIKLLGINHILWIIAEIYDDANGEYVAEEIRSIVRSRHDITDPDKDDFAVTTMEEALEIVNNILFGITWLLIALSLISLVVGGVGIMNVMYVSVAERTFEIGLRKSVGASKEDILFQFLTEAVLITFLGGIIGIIIGILISFIISFIATSQGLEWVFRIPISAILISVIFSSIVGLVFGTSPAINASKLNPIDAIKKE